MNNARYFVNHSNNNSKSSSEDIASERGFVFFLLSAAFIIFLLAAALVADTSAHRHILLLLLCVSTRLSRTSDTSLSRCYTLLMRQSHVSSHASVLRYSFVKSHARCVHIALERSKLNDLKVQRTLTRTSWCDGAFTNCNAHFDPLSLQS